MRLLAATHRDLLRAVEVGQFREDLYGRLAGILLTLPPLRQRREDILMLLNRALAGSAQGIASELVEQLLLYRWPRNVREIMQVADTETADDDLREIARARGVTMAQVAMAWVLRQPGITSPIVGATKPHHLDDAIAGEALRLTDDEATRLEELYRPHPATEAFS